MTEKPSERFIPWLNEHYDVGPDGIVCRRCGQDVRYVTKHAAVRHGDDIEVMPVHPSSRHLAEAY